MNLLNTMEEIRAARNGKGMSLLYVSRPECGVCVALKPKVVQMAEERFPEMRVWYVDLDRIPEAAGELSVFTIPGILVYADGKELVREARYVALDDLGAKIHRPYSMIFSE